MVDKEQKQVHILTQATYDDACQIIESSRDGAYQLSRSISKPIGRIKYALN